MSVKKLGNTVNNARYPIQTINSTSASSTTRAPVLGATPTVGNYLILYALSEGSDAVSTVVTTNVTWSLVAQTTAAQAPVIEIWKGLVGSSPGTTTTVTWAASTFHNAVVMEWSGLSGTLELSATRHSTTDATGAHPVPLLTPINPAALAVIGISTTSNSTQFSGFTGLYMLTAATATCGCYYGFPGRNTIMGSAVGGSSATTSGITLSIS